MTKIQWSPDDRSYRYGLDRGVLYVGTDAQAWTGLSSVNVKQGDNKIVSYYQDGRVYLVRKKIARPSLSLSAFETPSIFVKCEGYHITQDGVLVWGQQKSSFGLTYRTMLQDGNESEYEIHIWYGLVLDTQDDVYKTLSSGTNIGTKTWPISSKPVHTPNLPDISHLIVSTKTSPPWVIYRLEEMLYGKSGDAFLPSISEILEIYTPDNIPYDGDDFFVIPGEGDVFYLVGNDSAIQDHGDGTFTVNHKSVTVNTDDTYTINY